MTATTEETLTARDRGRIYIEEHANSVGSTPTYRCAKCLDSGWLRYDVLPSDPNFTRIVHCPHCDTIARHQQEREARKRGAA